MPPRSNRLVAAAPPHLRLNPFLLESRWLGTPKRVGFSLNPTWLRSLPSERRQFDEISIRVACSVGRAQFHNLGGRGICRHMHMALSIGSSCARKAVSRSLNRTGADPCRVHRLSEENCPNGMCHLHRIARRLHHLAEVLTALPNASRLGIRISSYSRDARTPSAPASKAR